MFVAGGNKIKLVRIKRYFFHFYDHHRSQRDPLPFCTNRLFYLYRSGRGHIRFLFVHSFSVLFFGAGQSSLVARKAHNLEVTGSNPVSAKFEFCQKFEVDQTLKSKYSQRGITGLGKWQVSCILREKSAVNFYIIFDLYKDDSMLIITDFGLILMSILFTQTIPCIENVNFL